MLVAAQDRIEIRPSGPFSLAQAERFLEGWGSAAYGRAGSDGHVHLAFVPDGEEHAAGVCVQQHEDTVTVDAWGPYGAEQLRGQVERILSLNIDGSGYPEVGRRDPVIGTLQEQFPGLRPVLFYSPYEAAAWAIVSQRVRMTQAARVKTRMAEELGEAVDIHGDVRYAFPGPARLAGLGRFPGLMGRKPEYLRALADATLEGRLDAPHLRSLPEEDALRELHLLPGVGDFSARLILVRGAGLADAPVGREPRFMQVFADLYGTGSDPADMEIEAITNHWIPYRVWCSVLLRTSVMES